ncbi:hypothetical protein ABZW11_33745 [Nonomuraea sp. NPDC004580]|uniref:hypothetical protein n=1 Tax=Nonomuraea sp. NPDC004580 TaxID=3154552 RepID=UPI0033AE563F
MPPLQREKAGRFLEAVQVRPASSETAARAPLLPYRFQRSCWKTVTRRCGRLGSAASAGRTSVLGLRT